MHDISILICMRCRWRCARGLPVEHTTIYVSSYYFMCPHTTICVLILCMCPHTIYVSAYYYMCVFILLYMCPHYSILQYQVTLGESLRKLEAEYSNSVRPHTLVA